MKKLTICCSILLTFGILFSAAAVVTQAQVTKPDPADLNIQITKPKPGGMKVPVVVMDNNFEPQKFKPPLGYKPGIGGIAYEVWITTDGVLHCKTSSTLKSASISFIAPIINSTDANGETIPKVAEGAFYLPKLNKPEDSDAYLFDLAKTNYKVKHAITLYITSTSGSKAEVTLTNKKVPAKIEK